MQQQDSFKMSSCWSERREQVRVQVRVVEVQEHRYVDHQDRRQHESQTDCTCK